MDELISEWREKGAPLETKVTGEKFLVTTKNPYIHIPHFLFPKNIRNNDNYIVLLSAVCRWLGREVEEFGVKIFTFLLLI